MSMVRPILVALLLAGCSSTSSEHGHVPDAVSAAIFERFKELQPPFDSATAYKTLGDSWTRHVYFYSGIVGYVPLHDSGDDAGNIILVAYFRSGTRTDSGYAIYMHVFSRANVEIGKRNMKRPGPAYYPDGWEPPFPDGFALKFFQGHTSSDIYVDEYTLCYPDGHEFNVQRKSRKNIPSPWTFSPQ